VRVEKAVPFGEHRHPEIEISWCIRGSYGIRVGSRSVLLQPGDLAIVKPMAAHAFPEDASAGGQRMTLEVGPAMLGEHFQRFYAMERDVEVFSLAGSGEPLYGQVLAELEELAEAQQNRSAYYALTFKGCIYKLSVLLLQLLSGDRPADTQRGAMRDVEKIDRALQIIYNHYAEPLELDEVSRACGYSKSSFCRQFRQITGETFHSVLNRHRVEIACLHLKETGSTIESIAFSVGFGDVKTFCRVFRKLKGETAGSYRKRSRGDCESL